MNNIHYVYKITNLLNNKIYIGVRTHPNPEKDVYMGSSKIMNSLYKIEGIQNFKKDIINIFLTREEAEQYESSLLTEEFCNNIETYNIVNTGKFSENKHCFRKDLWYDYYNEIREKYLKGEDTKKLAKYYNCNSNTITTIISDIKRTNSEAQKLRFINNPDSNKGQKEWFKTQITSGARNLILDKKIDLIIDLYINQNKSLIFISKKLGVSKGCIRKRLIENKIPLRENSESQKIRSFNGRRKSKAWDYDKEILLLYNKGESLKKLSKKYNCDMGTIKNIIKNGL